jgi:alpha-beta hydrolase superfamily lysophospholipase
MSEAMARWFGPADRPLFGWLHAPPDGQARGAVILCAPLAREHTSAHYTYRLLAESLARSGLLAVRFDYDGTGDSAGADEDPGRVEAWLSSIGHAVDLARASGAQSVSIVGMRMGALLAAAWAARSGGVESLVLWDPCVSGRAFVKEQRALQRLRTDAPSSVADGAAELPGFVLRADTVADLAALEVGPGTGPVAGHVLLCTREDRLPAAQFLELLGCPDEARLRADGQAELLDVEPLYHEVPAETLEQISQWLSEVHSGPARPVSIAPQTDARWSSGGGVNVTERLVALGPVGLFGIETTAQDSTDRPTVLFLNSGNDWHVGPNRLWVTLSRRWAQAGYRCVRFDESGLGDSPVHPGQSRHTIWAPQAFDDVAAVAAAVSPQDPADVVLAGLCSGAYQALESALWCAPRGVLAVNPVLRFDPPELAVGSLDPRRKICRPTNPLVSSYRALAFPALRRRLGALAWRLANAANRARSPRHWLAQLVAEGVDTYCICGEDEARPLTEGTGLETLQASSDSCLQVDVVVGLDHALMAADQRALVADRLTEHLFERFGAGPASPAQRSATMAAQLSIG